MIGTLSSMIYSVCMKNKKVLYINQYFKHPSEPGITRSYWICQELLARGYSITMLAHRNVNLNLRESPPLIERVEVDGIDVVYVRNKYSNSMGVVSRLFSFLKFLFFSIFYALRESNVGLVIATSTPLTVAVPALLRKWFRGTPYIFEVRDLWPEVPIQMGAITNSLLVRLLRWFESIVYKNAMHVVALSPGMQDGVVKYISKDKTSMIPNMSKKDVFKPGKRDERLIREYGLKEVRLRVIYFGTLGLANAIPYILDSIKLINKTNMNEIEFLFFGHGKYFNEIQELATNEQGHNVKLYERVPLADLVGVLNLCDLSLVTFTNFPILYTNSPNKLFDSISAGLPVVVNSPGWTKDLVDRTDCGYYVDPDNPTELVELYKRLITDKSEAVVKGYKARELAKNEFDKSILCKRFADKVDQIYRV